MFVCDFVCVCPCKIDLTGLTFVKFYNDNQKQFFLFLSCFSVIISWEHLSRIPWGTLLSSRIVFIISMQYWGLLFIEAGQFVRKNLILWPLFLHSSFSVAPDSSHFPSKLEYLISPNM